MRTRHIAAGMLAVALMLSGLSPRQAAAEPVTEGWTAWGHDASRTYAHPAPSSHDLTPLQYTSAYAAPRPSGGQTGSGPTALRPRLRPISRRTRRNTESPPCLS